MNEAQTRAELIDPLLRQAGWGVVPESVILREERAYQITPGKILNGGKRSNPLKADYILVYKGQKIAVVEAKSNEESYSEGVAQAKLYAKMLHIDHTYATNGKEIYAIQMSTGKEELIDRFPTPEELWEAVYGNVNQWRDLFMGVPFELSGGTRDARYYQEIAVNKVMNAVAENRERILLTLATGTGKTFIAFQICWKLFQTRWNLKRDGSRRPRILFLADRNILANQAFNDFSAFNEDVLARISPDEIRKKGKVPTNGSIFFTIFQTFMSGTDDEGKPAPYFGEYPNDYFDFIIIDECHRGGANDESNWRGILEYFRPAVQLGLTATPKVKDNYTTYRYFGEPVYTYSLMDGINDGFLTPFKVKRIQTTIDTYQYTSDDTIIEGEIEEGRIYKEPDFNRSIEIKAREAKRVQIILSEINPYEKTIIFCATQDHAALIRDLVNQYKSVKDVNYCVRVTANDGALGDQYLRDFQDNEKTIPVILTTSQKLSTGVNARNVRNIALLRPINSMIEFKQIIGRGTRVFDGKDYFTILDFVNAYENFNKQGPEGWFDQPLEDIVIDEDNYDPNKKKQNKQEKDDDHVAENNDIKDYNKKEKKIIKIKLKDGKEREIHHMTNTSFWSAAGKPISAEEFIHQLFGAIPNFFTSEEELRKTWSLPSTRKALLDKMDSAGYGKSVLETLQKLIDAEKSDIFDVLEYIAYNKPPITRENRVLKAKNQILSDLQQNQKEFIDFVLDNYIKSGVDELDMEKLPELLTLKYHSLEDAMEVLGNEEVIMSSFVQFQQILYGIGA